MNEVSSKEEKEYQYAPPVWSGHACPLLLLLVLFLFHFPRKQNKFNTSTNGSGQECPLHTSPS
jgi:hypothetical protein